MPNQPTLNAIVIALNTVTNLMLYDREHQECGVAEEVEEGQFRCEFTFEGKVYIARELMGFDDAYLWLTNKAATMLEPGWGVEATATFAYEPQTQTGGTEANEKQLGSTALSDAELQQGCM